MVSRRKPANRAVFGNRVDKLKEAWDLAGH
jgi:hypothetical protein